MITRIRDRVGSFLRLRKQSDRVKIICLFVLTTAVFLIYTGYQVWQIYQYADAPAEYILTGEGTISSMRMDDLMQDGDVLGVSRQMKVSVAVQYGGTETALDCTMLSSEYMGDLFGRDIPPGGSRIYMNEAAFAEFQEAISDNIMGMTDGYDGTPEFDVRYSMGEDAAAVSSAGSDDPGEGTGMGIAARNYRSAKLIVLKTGGEEAESFIYTAQTESRLAREAAGIWVRFAKHDLDGLHVDNLRKLGYEIENEEMIMEEEYELQVKLLHIRYGLVICGICIVGAVMLRRNR